MLSEESVRKALSNRFLKIVSVVILGIAVAVVYNRIESVYWIRPLLTGRNPFSKLNGVYYYAGGLIRLCYYVVAVLIGAIVIAITIFCFWKIFEKLIRIMTESTMISDRSKR